MTTVPAGPAVNMSCVAHYATYVLDISFIDNIRSVEVSVEQDGVMNGTAVRFPAISWYMYPACGCTFCYNMGA